MLCNHKCYLVIWLKVRKTLALTNFYITWIFVNIVPFTTTSSQPKQSRFFFYFGNNLFSMNVFCNEIFIDDFENLLVPLLDSRDDSHLFLVAGVYTIYMFQVRRWCIPPDNPTRNLNVKAMVTQTTFGRQKSICLSK